MFGWRDRAVVVTALIALLILPLLYRPAEAADDMHAVAVGYAEAIRKMVVALGHATPEEADLALSETLAGLPADGPDPQTLDELRALYRDLAEETFASIERDAGAEAAEPLREEFERRVLLDQPTEEVVATALSRLPGSGTGVTALQRLFDELSGAKPGEEVGVNRPAEPTTGSDVGIAQPSDPPAGEEAVVVQPIQPAEPTTGSNVSVVQPSDPAAGSGASVAEPASPEMDAGASTTAGAECDLTGDWRMITEGIGESTWTLALGKENHYSAQEQGLGNASGSGLQTNNALDLEWQTGGYSGIVRLAIDPDCASANGEHIFYTGREGTFPTHWRRVRDTQRAAADDTNSAEVAARGDATSAQVVTQPQADSASGDQCTFAGTWRDHSGTIITMTQTGESVSGSYVFQGVASTIEGTDAGGVLTGVYRQPTYPDPQWQSGSLTLTLADCDNWSGSYTNDSGASRYGWSANRVASPPPQRSEPLLGSWRGCDGRVVEFTLEGGELVGRYAELGTLGGAGFNVGEIGYVAKPAGNGRYELQVLHRSADGSSAWQAGTVSVAGDLYSDNASDLCSQSMARVADPAPAAAQAATQSEGVNSQGGGGTDASVQSAEVGKQTVLPEQMRPPVRLVLQALIGVQQMSADLQKTGDSTWEWLEAGTRFQFEALSETGSELLILDPSRDMYHHLILTTGQTFWRVGTTGAWTPHYTIVTIERAGG